MTVPQRFSDTFFFFLPVSPAGASLLARFLRPVARYRLSAVQRPAPRMRLGGAVHASATPRCMSESTTGSSAADTSIFFPVKQKKSVFPQEIINTSYQKLPFGSGDYPDKLFFHQALNQVSNSSGRELPRDMFRFKTV